MSGVKYQGFRGATDSYERRIVLVGKTGIGKSAAGNTILGREVFESKLSPASKTAECQKANGNVGDRKVAVIDTPGLYDTTFPQEEVLKRIKMCLSFSAPGPHAFLVVLQLGRFTLEEQETIKMIQTTFGEDAAKYTMVLFTHGDQLRKQTIEGYISESTHLQMIIQNCYGQYHVFNNEIEDPAQTNMLLDKIDKMTMANSGRYYTNEMFMRAEEAIEKEKERILKEMEAQKQKELDELRAKLASGTYQREERRVQMRYECEARARAERLNGFIVAGFIIVGGLVGGPIGAAIAMEAGAAVGAAVGGAVGAAATIGALRVKVSQRCYVQ